jgi:hypothetical protein
MTTRVKEKLIKEIEDLPLEAQEKIFKMVHFMKKEILIKSKKAKTKGRNALSDVDKIAVDTGIHDLSFQHDHYLYGVPKK